MGLSVGEILRRFVPRVDKENTFTAKQTFAAGLDAGSQPISNVGNPVQPTDAINLQTLKSFDFDAGDF